MEDGKHYPHGRDWSSIREAGWNAAYRNPDTETLLAGFYDELLI
jgi:hypothetical protein